MQTSNGTLLASLISPLHGMDAVVFLQRPVSLTMINNKLNCSLIQQNRIDWAAAPSGLETKGSFNEVIVPALLKVFNKDYTLHLRSSAGWRRNL